MSTFGLICTIVSIAIFAVWLTICIKKFGLAPSYSAYNPMWDKAVPIDNMHLWSIITFVIAASFMVGMIERGDNSGWQFLGFFAPMYLVVVALFPLTDLPPDANEYDIKRHKRQEIIHVVGASLCATCTIAWVIFVAHLWWLLLVALFVVACCAYFTKTILTSTVFWLEMILFLAGYPAILIGG